MGNGWSPQDVTLPGLAAIGASQTNAPLSKDFPITAGGACKAMVVKIKVSAATVTTAITAKIRSAIKGDFVDAKTVSITGAGDFYIKLQDNVAGDQAFMPLLRTGRIVVTTGAGDSVTVTDVEILQPL